jgi:hypothetical protein
MKTIYPQKAKRRFHGRTRTRLLSACLAVGEAVTLWAVTVLLLGIPITVPQRPGATEHEPLRFIPVLLAALIASTGAWGLLEVLERISSAGLRIWTVIGVAVFVLTLPYMPGFTLTERLFLTVLHSAVAGIVLFGMRPRSEQA